MVNSEHVVESTTTAAGLAVIAALLSCSVLLFSVVLLLFAIHAPKECRA